MNSTPSFRAATRDQQSILSPLEKRVLAWLAAHMPQWVHSDHLTLLGFAAMILTGVCYYLTQWDRRMLLAAIACLALNWFGDSLDGTLARYRNRQRPRYGFYVDHIVDTFGALFILFGLALSGYMTERVAAALLIVFFMLAINTYLTTYTLGVFRISQWKMGPTEMRLILMIGNAYLLHRSTTRIHGHVYLLFDVGGVVAVISMAVVLIFSSIKNTFILYKLERLPEQ